MSLTQLFSRETNVALFATRRRRVLLGACTVGWIAVAALVISLFPDVVPWWVWFVMTGALYIGECFLGSYWANQDLLRRMQEDDLTNDRRTP